MARITWHWFDIPVIIHLGIMIWMANSKAGQKFFIDFTKERDSADNNSSSNIRQFQQSRSSNPVPNGTSHGVPERRSEDRDAA